MSVTVLLAMPLGKFIAVTVTPGRAAPLASRIDPVSVVAATPGFEVVDGSILGVGATATAGGFAGAAGDCAVKPVACGSLRCDPAFGSVDERRAAYVTYLCARVQAPREFAQEAIRARSQHV